EFKSRRDAMYNGLLTIPGVKIVKPEGAFYAYPDFGEAMSNLGFTEDILDILLRVGVCCVPGWGFTKQGHFLSSVRLSYSGASVQSINEAIKRMKELFDFSPKNLSPNKIENEVHK